MPYERISTFGGKLACRSFQIDLFLCKNALLSLVYSLTHSLAHINRAICLTSRVNFFRSVPLFPSPFCFVRFSMSDIQTSVWCTLFSVFFCCYTHLLLSSVVLEHHQFCISKHRRYLFYCVFNPILLFPLSRVFLFILNLFSSNTKWHQHWTNQHQTSPAPLSLTVNSRKSICPNTKANTSYCSSIHWICKY